MSNICPKCGEDHDEARAFYERMDADVDAYDLAQMEAAKAEGPATPYDEFRKELLGGDGDEVISVARKDMGS